MAKACINYETGNLEIIERNGFSHDTGDFTLSWDQTPYLNEEKEKKSQPKRKGLWLFGRNR